MNNAQLHGCSLEGWECFHCGEVFTTVGAAEDHFGGVQGALTGCQIKAGEERGLLMELRKAQAENAALKAELARKPMWISAEYDLPTYRKAVLVWCPERRNMYSAFFDSDKGVGWRHFESGHRVTEKVTDWMWVTAPTLPPEREIAQEDVK